MGIHAFSSNSCLLRAVLASTNAQYGNGARQYENKCSHEGHSSGEMERTWALTTADLGSKAALSVKLEYPHPAHSVIDNRTLWEGLLNAVCIYLFNLP